MNALTDLFTFERYGDLLLLVSNSIIAAAVLGMVGGLMSYFIVIRDIPFAVHGIAELSFAGAAFALLMSLDVVMGSIIGSLVAAVIIGFGGLKESEKNSIIGVLMPFGLGLGILFLALYDGRAANKFGLLTGQIVAVNDSQLRLLMISAVIVVVILAVIWRPLMFSSIDPDIAMAKGVRTGWLTFFFMLALGLAVALSVQIVGVLLVMALLVTPAAAATQISSSPIMVPILSVVFATVSAVGGVLIALGSPVVPISPFVTTISFLIYLVARVVGKTRNRRHANARARRQLELDQRNATAADCSAQDQQPG